MNAIDRHRARGVDPVNFSSPWRSRFERVNLRPRQRYQPGFRNAPVERFSHRQAGAGAFIRQLRAQDRAARYLPPLLIVRCDAPGGISELSDRLGRAGHPRGGRVRPSLERGGQTPGDPGCGYQDTVPVADGPGGFRRPTHRGHRETCCEIPR